jgi:hypothetical protein
MVNDPNANCCGFLDVANHCIVKHPDFKQENIKTILIVRVAKLIRFILLKVQHC